jgi:hypothetical protein
MSTAVSQCFDIRSSKVNDLLAGIDSILRYGVCAVDRSGVAVRHIEACGGGNNAEKCSPQVSNLSFDNGTIPMPPAIAAMLEYGSPSRRR